MENPEEPDQWKFDMARIMAELERRVSLQRLHDALLSLLHRNDGPEAGKPVPVAPNGPPSDESAEVA